MKMNRSIVGNVGVDGNMAVAGITQMSVIGAIGSVIAVSAVGYVLIAE